MTREIRFELNNTDITEDCYLPPDDPMHEFIRTNNPNVFNEPKKVSLEEQHIEYQRKLTLAKEQGIRPGSPSWYYL